MERAIRRKPTTTTTKTQHLSTSRDCNNFCMISFDFFFISVICYVSHTVRLIFQQVLITIIYTLTNVCNHYNINIDSRASHYCQLPTTLCKKENSFHRHCCCIRKNYSNNLVIFEILSIITKSIRLFIPRSNISTTIILFLLFGTSTSCCHSATFIDKTTSTMPFSSYDRIRRVTCMKYKQCLSFQQTSRNNKVQSSTYHLSYNDNNRFLSSSSSSSSLSKTTITITKTSLFSSTRGRPRKQTNKQQQAASTATTSAATSFVIDTSPTTSTNDVSFVIDDETLRSSFILPDLKDYDNNNKVFFDNNKNNAKNKSKYEKKLPFQPNDILDPLYQIPYPKSLSPSSISEYKKCPQSYLFQYILGMKQPTTTTLVKGSMCHAALQQIFDIEPSNTRTLSVLQNLFRSIWSEHRDKEPYYSLFTTTNNNTNNNDSNNNVTMTQQQRDIQAETKWGRESLQLLANYWQKEDPSQIIRPNPVFREVWVSTKLRTNYTTTDIDTTPPTTTTDNNNNEFLVRGIIDRLDMVRSYDNIDEPVTLRLIDYKTGKVPDLKYSKSMNEKIKNESFDQLLIYALLIREKNKMNNYMNQNNVKKSIPLRYLRLFYLTSDRSDDPLANENNEYWNMNQQQYNYDTAAVYWDMDLGATQIERDIVLDNVYNDLINVWESIHDLISKQNMKLFHGCNRSFCYCHKCRSIFPEGSIWEPPSPL